jgi:hypothetical protein
MFEAARGAAAYGAFHYPLLSLAPDQIRRVCVAAARRRCLDLDPPIDAQSGGAAVDALVAAGVLDRKPDPVVGHLMTEFTWRATVDIAEMVSLPDRQSLVAPPQVLGDLDRASRRIS